jgi:hypothetical protein
MRILTKEQFIKEPFGAVYCTCVNSCFTGELEIKDSKRSDDGESWYALGVAPWLTSEMDSFGEHPNGEEIETESFCTDDAVYNYDNKTMYAVFSKEELRGMIERLWRAFSGEHDGWPTTV